MKTEVIETLLRLNREFYQSFAEPFADSRPTLQPGVAHYLRRVESTSRVLDLGCGHGALAHSLEDQGHQGLYIGVDSSPRLLTIARDGTNHPRSEFLHVDLSQESWETALPSEFDWVFCLATLHHIPSLELRGAWAHALKAVLKRGGWVLISVWNFLAEPKWRARTVPWTELHLAQADVDPGDYLLDWRRGGRGLRYVHHFEEAELEHLTSLAGCERREKAFAGGTSGKLNRIELWQAT